MLGLRRITAAMLMTAAASLAHGQPTPQAAKLGVDLDGLGDGGRSRPFVRLDRTHRAWTQPDGRGDVPLDEMGWPRADASTVLFDIRPTFAWAPPMDDPEAYQPDWGGRYPFSLKGRAEVAIAEGPGCAVEHLRYDAAANTTTGEIVVPKPCGILAVSFKKTRRDASAPEGTGFADLRIVRPGYPFDTKKIFTDEFLRSLKPFAVIRYMDWLSTNHNPGYYGDVGHHALEWPDRRPADYSTQASIVGKKYGVAWEFITALANESGKDVWINVPIAATDGYIRELAAFFKRGLKPGLKVYIEHSNEVWNFGFPQYIYNKLAAIDEVKRGGSSLNADGAKDEEVWAHRRHAKRLIEIGRAFRAAFADDPDRVRPIYASWAISPGPHFADVLAWVEKTYGPPKDHFYGLADAAYYDPGDMALAAKAERIVAAMKETSDANLAKRLKIREVADRYGLKHCQYEIGPGVGPIGDARNVGERIRANRIPAIGDAVLHDALDNWFNRGGDLYMYFAHIGPYSRFGCWGLTEDVDRLDTPKWRAIEKLTGVKAR